MYQIFIEHPTNTHLVGKTDSIMTVLMVRDELSRRGYEVTVIGW